MQFKWVCRKNATKSRDVAFLQQKIVGCHVLPAMHTGFAGELRHLKLMVSRFSKVGQSSTPRRPEHMRFYCSTLTSERGASGAVKVPNTVGRITCDSTLYA